MSTTKTTHKVTAVLVNKEAFRSQWLYESRCSCGRLLGTFQRKTFAASQVCPEGEK